MPMMQIKGVALGGPAKFSQEPQCRTGKVFVPLRLAFAKQYSFKFKTAIMDYQFEQSSLSRPILTSVLVGFGVTVICLLFNAFYREGTGYRPADYINVSSLIFAINLIFLVAGLVYTLFLHLFKKADLVFEVLFGVLTLLCIWGATRATMGNSKVLSSEFETLLTVIVALIGIGITVLVPYLFRHKKIIDYFI